MPNRSSGEKTKILLAESLRDLIKKKPFDKIKIREIVEKCGLNRQTFYYHFQDIYSLVEWMYKYDGKKIIKQNFREKDFYFVCREMLRYIEEHRDELMSVIDSKAEVYFENFLLEGVRQCFDIIIYRKTRDKRVTEDFRNFLSMYYANAVVGVGIDWIKSDEPDRPTDEELLNMYQVTIMGSINLAIKNYINSLPPEE